MLSFVLFSALCPLITTLHCYSCREGVVKNFVLNGENHDPAILGLDTECRETAACVEGELCGYANKTMRFNDPQLEVDFSALVEVSGCVAEWPSYFCDQPQEASLLHKVQQLGFSLEGVSLSAEEVDYTCSGSKQCYSSLCNAAEKESSVPDYHGFADNYNINSHYDYDMAEELDYANLVRRKDYLCSYDQVDGLKLTSRHRFFGKYRLNVKNALQRCGKMRKCKGISCYTTKLGRKRCGLVNSIAEETKKKDEKFLSYILKSCTDVEGG